MNQTHQLKRIRCLYYSLTGLFWFSTALLAPLYVVFLMDRGLDLGDIGLWAGANTLAVLLLELPTGGLADAWGRGRTFAAANLVIAASLFLMVLIPGRRILFIGAAVFGAGRALSSGSLEAWFIDSLKETDPETDIEKQLGPAGAVSLLALAAGSLLGSLLPVYAESIFVGSRLPSMALPLLADAVLKILLAVLTALTIRDSGMHSSAFRALTSSLKAVPAALGSVRTAVAGNPRIRRLLAVGSILAFGSGSLENLWQPRFVEVSGRDSGAAFGLVLSACFIAGAAGSMLVPRITERLGRRRHLTAFLGALSSSAALLTLSVAQGPISTALALALVYFLLEGIGVPRKAMLNDEIPSDIRATMLSVDSLALYIGFAGIVALGYLAEKSGIPVVWRVVAGVFFAGAWLYPGLGRMNSDGTQNPGRINGRAAEGGDSCRSVV